ncbi:hypothetical protein LshimejAT787_2400560 [Lyophyllum shimeji]|uniref:Uncharacterized protein n=1 Tax=Lyophyllum shimeji TaxID=47721 RepID=A0A9P3Q0W4_LYOSH|nr:hypothetical protein LshimejAT787_2400560 [Lyophyllum shimeji]
MSISLPTTTLPTTTSTTPTSTSTTTTTTSTSTTTSPTTTGPTTTSPTTTTGPTSTTSATTTSTTSPTSTSTSSTSTTSLVTPSTGGNVVTTTSVIAITPTLSPPTGSAAPSTNKGFFQNTGAVAGVFTVVGLVAVALCIALITNIVRRRRAQKFDREIAEAAAEAAAAPAPIFLDDDDDDDDRRRPYGAGGYADHPYNSGGGYSDVSSHGTYGQPPLSTGHGSGSESYNMRELGPSPGDIYNAYGAAGAAGVGVARARSTRDPGAFANGLQDGAMPYAAFAGPAYHNPQQPQPQQQQYANMGHGYNRGPGSPEYDLLEAAGLGAAAAGQQQQQYAPQPPGYLPNPFANDYPTSSAAPAPAYTNPSGVSPPPEKAGYAPRPAVQEDAEDAYGGYVGDGGRAQSASGHSQGQESAGSVYDDEHQHHGQEEEEEEEREVPRVLKVANE